VGDILDQPKTVLDIGCGNGHTLNYLQHKWHETKLYGLDFSPVAISIAKTRVPSAKFIVGTIDDFHEKVELALLLGVAEHFEDINELGKIKNVLNNSGLLYMEVPNLMSDKNKQEGFYKGEVQEEWHLSRPSWENIIEEQGYKVANSFVGDLPSCEFIWILEKNG
jgi:trans-aconitate methyltransferase